MVFTYELRMVMKRLLAGDVDAFQGFYINTVNDMYFHTKLIIGNDEETARMMVKIYKAMFINLERLDKPENTTKWYNAILYQHLVDWVNVNCANQLIGEENGEYDEYPGVEEYVRGTNTLNESEVANLAASFINTLDPVHALTGLAYFYDGFEDADLEKYLQCDIDVVKTRVKYARKQISMYSLEFCKANDYESARVDNNLLLLGYVLIFNEVKLSNIEGLYAAICDALQ